MGVMKDRNIFWGLKIGKRSFVGGRIFVQQQQISRAEHSRMNPVNAFQVAIRYSFIKFCIYCFSRWYEFFVRYALRVEKNYQHGLDAEPNFSSASVHTCQ
jgi:hypothetical protein